MRFQNSRLVVCGLVIGVVLLAAILVGRAHSQGGGQRTGAVSQPASQAQMNAEREQIWNSPSMLRARAWVQDYCSKSAKITPAEAKKYMTELANLTPTQMKLWLLKFDHDESQRQQQYSLWQQAHASALSQAVAANQATQRAYGDISRGETEAAGEAQQQINEQTQAAQGMQEAKQLDAVGPYGPYGYGGIHYHYHLYPYTY